MKDNALTLCILDKLENNTLILPTLPDIALKVREAADDPEIDISGLADVISTDPALASRIIRYGNTSMVRGNKVVTDVKDACMRMGLAKVKIIATALALEQLFVTDSDVIKIQMHKAWMDTVTITANATAAFAVCRKVARLNADTMFLTALVHRIGIIAVINEASYDPKRYGSEAFLKNTANRVCPIIGGQILKKWDFEQPIVSAVEKWSTLRNDGEGVIYADYLRIAGVLVGIFGRNESKVIKHCQSKNMFEDMDVFESDKFLEVQNAVLASFL